MKYKQYCAACHQKDGKRVGLRFPLQVKSDWVSRDKERLIEVVLSGLEETHRGEWQELYGCYACFQYLN